MTTQFQHLDGTVCTSEMYSPGPNVRRESIGICVDHDRRVREVEVKVKVEPGIPPLTVETGAVREHLAAVFYPEFNEVEISCSDYVLAKMPAKDLEQVRAGLNAHFGPVFGTVLMQHVLETYKGA